MNELKDWMYSAGTYLFRRVGQEDSSSLIQRAILELESIEGELPAGRVLATDVYEQLAERLDDVALAYDNDLRQALVSYVVAGVMLDRGKELS